MTRFDRDTAVRPLGDGRYEARIDPGWFVVRGPNGGYIAAMLLRALAARVDDPARAPRSLTIHYTAPPVEGPAWIDTTIERSGRSLTSVSARLRQGDRLLALALAAFSLPREAASFRDVSPPQVAPPEQCLVLPAAHPDPRALRAALGDRRAALLAAARSRRAAAGSGSPRARAPLDAPLVGRVQRRLAAGGLRRASPTGRSTGGVPTIDLTIHFRSALPPADVAPGDFALACFRSRYARDGFLEEDGEIWSASGELLAHSRQLALLL